MSKFLADNVSELNGREASGERGRRGWGVKPLYTPCWLWHTEPLGAYLTEQPTSPAHYYGAKSRQGGFFQKNFCGIRLHKRAEQNKQWPHVHLCCLQHRLSIGWYRREINKMRPSPLGALNLSTTHLMVNHRGGDGLVIHRTSSLENWKISILVCEVFMNGGRGVKQPI